MRKWAMAVLILALVGATFGVSGSGKDNNTSSKGEGVPTEPTEVFVDTAANIFIFLTLRQPPGPPAPIIYVKSVSVDSSEETVEIKATGDGPEDRNQTWFVYRAPWALFSWDDIDMFGDGDSAIMIDPIEEADSSDLGDYNWSGPNITTDIFADTNLYDSSRGVNDPDVNYFYTVAAMDTFGNLSEKPSDPIGEYDQVIIGGATNHITLPLRCHELELHGDSAHVFGDLIPGCEGLTKFNPSSQTWELICAKLFGSWFYNPSAPTVYVRPADVITLTLSDSLTAGDEYLFTLGYDANNDSGYEPRGFVPVDTCYKFEKKSGDPAGYVFFMVPYQEYNTLVNIYGDYPLRADKLAESIDSKSGIDGEVLYRWNPYPPTITALAVKLFGSWYVTSPPEFVRPGEVLLLLMAGSGGYWPTCP